MKPSWTFEGEIAPSTKSPRASRVFTRKTQSKPTLWVFTSNNQDLVWTDKNEWVDGSSLSLIQVGRVKAKDGSVMLTFADQDLIIKPTNVSAETALRLIVEAAAAVQGVSCCSISEVNGSCCFWGVVSQLKSLRTTLIMRRAGSKRLGPRGNRALLRSTNLCFLCSTR